MPNRPVIKWPAVIHYCGDPELTYVANPSQWYDDKELHCFGYEPADRLVDSDGSIYSLQNVTDGDLDPISTGEQLSLAAMELMLQAHFCSAGDCCVAKYSAASIAEGIKNIGHLQNS